MVHGQCSLPSNTSIVGASLLMVLRSLGESTLDLNLRSTPMTRVRAPYSYYGKITIEYGELVKKFENVSMVRFDCNRDKKFEESITWVLNKDIDYVINDDKILIHCGNV
jgi:hypothetical protein